MVVATAVAMARPVLVPACGSSSVEGDSRVVMLVTPWGLVVVESGVVDGSKSVVISVDSGVDGADCGVALLGVGLLMERGEAEDGED